MDKRGISAIVATVLIILITVAAVTIVWAAIIPMITTNLELGTACLEADVLIDSGLGYTCYDADNKVLAVQVKKGANEVNISKIELLLGSDGNSKKVTTLFDLGSNTGKTFYFVVDDDVDDVSIAPVIKIRNKERVCDISSNVKLGKCNLGNAFGDFLNEQGVVGFWRFEDNTDDLTGNNDGTRNGNPVFVEGRNGIGRALNFDGVDDFVDCGSDSTITSMDNNFTVSIWFKALECQPAHNRYIFSRNQGYAFMICNGGVSSNFGYIVYNKSGHSDFAWTSGIDLVDNMWHHGVLLFENHYASLYLDGLLLQNQSYGDMGNTHNTFAGAWATNYGFFNGTIDEVKIYNRVLSLGEIEELYENGI